MTGDPQLIGILGGTFDPVHHAHLRCALDLQEQLRLAELRFMPLGTAVHRSQPQADAAQRLAMLQRATADLPGVVVDDRELRRGGPSYSIDTLRTLRTELGADTPLCWIMGSDAFQHFLSWRRPDEILGLAHLVVMHRPGYHLPEDAQLQRLVEHHRSDLPGELHQAPGGYILFAPVTRLEISATDLRQRLAHGRSARFLTPDSVLAYIDEHGIYR